MKCLWHFIYSAEYRHTWADIDPDFIAADVLHAVKWIIDDRR